jgi:hypothetical protein
MLPLNNELFTLSSSPEEFAENGAAYSILFKFIKVLSLGLLLTVFPLSVYLMVSYSKGDDCTMIEKNFSHAFLKFKTGYIKRTGSVLVDGEVDRFGSRGNSSTSKSKWCWLIGR